MPHTFKGERTLMRIFIAESDKCRAGPSKGRPLYEALLACFRKHDLPGATVLRGVAGFGAHSRMHTEKVLRLAIDLPLVVEVVAREEELQRVMPELDLMIDGGLITLERARIIMYRPHDMPEDERWKHRIDDLVPEAEPPASA
jgi:PII-like signaling protein